MKRYSERAKSREHGSVGEDDDVRYELGWWRLS